MTEAQIKYMVDRFLMWKLPEHFCPDNGISFDPIAGASGPHPFRREPVGTNLLTATQADAMVRHMLDGMPTDPFSAALQDSVLLGTGFLQITRLDPSTVAIKPDAT